MEDLPARPRLRGLHRASALFIGLFVLLHMANHLAGLSGQETHIAFMAEARQLYRQPFVEVALVCLILWQVGSGLTMLVRGWAKRKGTVAWLQAVSGGYLAFFLVNHVGAVIAGRTVFGLDTDFRFAAAGFFAPPWHWFFGPTIFSGLSRCLSMSVAPPTGTSGPTAPRWGRPCLEVLPEWGRCLRR